MISLSVKSIASNIHRFRGDLAGTKFVHHVAGFVDNVSCTFTKNIHVAG